MLRWKYFLQFVSYHNANVFKYSFIRQFPLNGLILSGCYVCHRRVIHFITLFSISNETNDHFSEQSVLCIIYLNVFSYRWTWRLPWYWLTFASFFRRFTTILTWVSFDDKSWFFRRIKEYYFFPKWSYPKKDDSFQSAYSMRTKVIVIYTNWEKLHLFVKCLFTHREDR